CPGSGMPPLRQGPHRSPRAVHAGHSGHNVACASVILFNGGSSVGRVAPGWRCPLAILVPIRDVVSWVTQDYAVTGMALDSSAGDTAPTPATSPVMTRR